MIPIIGKSRIDLTLIELRRKHHFYNAFCGQGWAYAEEDEVNSYDHTVYKLNIQVNSNDIIYAYVADRNDSDDWGIAWIEVYYENQNRSLAKYEIEWIKKDFEIAEDKLLASGIPFIADYKFSGKNKAYKKRKNDKARKLWQTIYYIPELFSPH
jgi:hypothetical protein